LVTAQKSLLFDLDSDEGDSPLYPGALSWDGSGNHVNSFDYLLDLEGLDLPLSFYDPALSTFKIFFSSFITWLCDLSRHGNMFLISEPPLIKRQGSVRNWPIMKATLRICHEVQRRGADMFYPDRDGWIREIYEGLAKRYPPYRRLLAEQHKDDPTIFERLSVRSLLRKLIIEPWMALRDAHPIYAANPPVVFLHFSTASDSDMLDALELINEDRHNNGPHCLLWVVFCPWAPDVSPLISKIFHQSPSRYHHLTGFIGTDEADSYTEKVLRIHFEVVKRHPDIFHADEIWPPEEDLQRLSKAASGDDYFMELLVRFIHFGACHRGPRERLQKCLNYITGLPRPTLESPYLPLILFYDRALSDLFAESFPHAIHVMECIYTQYLTAKPSAPRIAQLLDMDQEHVALIATQFRWTLKQENSNQYRLLNRARHLIDKSHDQGRPLVARTSVQAVESYFRIWYKSPFSSMIPKHRPQSPEHPNLAVARLTLYGLTDSCRPWYIFLECQKEEEQRALVYLIRTFDFRRFVSRSNLLDFPHFLRWLYVR
jgi:hypothetical protein